MPSETVEADQLLRTVRGEHPKRGVARQLGREILLAIVERLRAAGHDDQDHRSKVYERILAAAREDLATRGGCVEHPGPWLHTIAYRVTIGYLVDLARVDTR